MAMWLAAAAALATLAIAPPPAAAIAVRRTSRRLVVPAAAAARRVTGTQAGGAAVATTDSGATWQPPTTAVCGTAGTFRDECGQIRLDEGVRTRAYRDTVGELTIGVGHLVTPADGISDGQEITMARVEELYARDLDAHALIAYRYINTGDGATTLSSNVDPSAFLALPLEVQRVLFNMAFNLGGRLAGFKNLRKAVKAGDWAAAAAAMGSSKWCTQVGPRCTRLRTRMAAVGTSGSTGTTGTGTTGTGSTGSTTHVVSDPDEPGPLMSDTPLDYPWLAELPYYVRYEAEAIKADEGVSLTVYRDPTRKTSESAVWKVGIGHYITPSDGLKAGDTITTERMDGFFKGDLAAAGQYARAFVANFEALDGELQRVLVNMAFQLRVSGRAHGTLSARVCRVRCAAASAAHPPAWLRTRSHTPTRARRAHWPASPHCVPPWKATMWMASPRRFDNPSGARTECPNAAPPWCPASPR